MASYIATAMKILAEDSDDDTYHQDTPTPPTFTLQLFLASLFFGLITFSNGEMNQKQRKFSRPSRPTFWHKLAQVEQVQAPSWYRACAMAQGMASIVGI